MRIDMKYASKIKSIYEERGISGVLLALWRRVFLILYSLPRNIIGGIWAKNFRGPKHEKFYFLGEEYEYFYHRYNATWDNERIIEVPIIQRIIEKNLSKKILEVGNVLSHYFPTSHDILDKYEHGKNVINQDVETFESARKYDVIISISTMEHVGWDFPDVRDPRKIGASLLNLKKYLTSGGEMFVTMPLGYNHEMDKQLFGGTLAFDEEYFLKRVDKGNRWEQVSKDLVRGSKYGSPFYAANAIVLGVIRQK